MHGGIVDIESEVGVGSTFTVHLPLHSLKANPEVTLPNLTVLTPDSEPEINTQFLPN
jgi:hypothetical protein